MDCKLEIINPILYKDWNKVLLASTGHSFFHSANWAAVLHQSYNYHPLYFSLVDSGCFKALIPLMEIKSLLTGRRAVSLPFTDYCEPILAEKKDLQMMKGAIEDYAASARLKYIEIRGGQEIANSQSPSATFYRHNLKLSKNDNDTFSSFRSSTKRNIKKAVKEGIAIEISQSSESISEFYRLNCFTRKNHGLPPQPFRFFENIYEHVISQDLGMIVTASYQNQIIAAAVYFHFGKKAIYKYGASDKSFQHLRANNLVMWEAIKWYAQNGYKNLCFGRTELHHTGLRQFKVGWGTEEEVVNYYKYDLLNERYIKDTPKSTRSYHRVMTRMPIPMLKLAGLLLYKHMG